MGCRGTIEIWENGAAPKDEESPVVLYTHWGAHEMLSDLKEVLSKRKRWGDAAYLSRMIFCQMVKGEEKDSTGYGIMTNNIFMIVISFCSAITLNIYGPNTIKSIPEKSNWILFLSGTSFKSDIWITFPWKSFNLDIILYISKYLIHFLY